MQIVSDVSEDVPQLKITSEVFLSFKSNRSVSDSACFGHNYRSWTRNSFAAASPAIASGPACRMVSLDLACKYASFTNMLLRIKKGKKYVCIKGLGCPKFPSTQLPKIIKDLWEPRMNVEQPWHQNILTSRVKLIQTELIKVKSCQTCSFEYLEKKRRVLQDLTASLYFRHLSSKMGVSAVHPMSHFPFARHPLKLGLSGAGAAAVSGAVCAASPSAMTLATRDKSSSRFAKVDFSLLFCLQ